MKSPATLVCMVVLSAILAAPAFAKTAAELLREGLYAEEVEGNLDAAIGIYEQVLRDSSAPRGLVAQALYRQGMCFMKKRQEQEARAVFQKLVTSYGDQTEIVEKVRPILEELGNADPATLMPPETLVYLEIGSPGRQVETILNMLKGTPLENPLAAISPGPDQPPSDGGQKSPLQMIGALFNPSMLAELKKIRGLGIGVIDITQNNLPAIVVLFPGRSDALRGLIQMVIGVLGQPADPIEGMQTVAFSDGGGGAYDDTVVILAGPSPKGNDLLRWCVRQYKGLANQPSLASHNKSFTRISKQVRQQNAVTLWMNMDEAYERLQKAVPADQLPQPLRIADDFVDFESMDDVIVTLSLRETGVALEANVAFLEGHASELYGLIHTPNLNRAALDVVPSEAAVLVSMTLAAGDTAQAQAASEKIKSAIGLDIGRELFDNVQQITLFALPSKEPAAAEPSQVPPFVTSLGLAVNSRDPQYTQKLLLSILRAAQLVTDETQTAETIPATGRHEIALANNMKLFSYTDPASRTLLLSLNPQIVEVSLAAMRTDRSVLNSGRLQDALATLSPATSKLVLVNVAGALQIAGQNVKFPSDEAAGRARQAIEELVNATQKTTLRLQTMEEANSLNVRLSVSDLPPINQVYEPVAQLSQMIAEARAQEAAAAVQVPISIPQASRPVGLDGKVDEWAGVPSHALEHVAYAPPASAEDLSATFQAQWDREGLYLLVDVVDDKPTHDSVEFWLDDSVEVFIDARNSKSEVYGNNDYQYYFTWEGSGFSAASTTGEARHDKVAGVSAESHPTDRGYRFRIKFPWSTLGVNPRAGAKIGLDVHVNDDDDGGDRDSKLMWHAENDVSWQQPSAFGTGELAGLIGWWKLDETEGTRAADSSGNGHKAAVHGDPVWQPQGGKLGGAIALDGDGDYLEVADESAFDFVGGVTVAAWIKANSLDKPWQAIVTKGEWAWRIQRNEETSTLEFACFGVNVPSESPYGSLYGTREITLGEWHHVAGTYDGKRMALYVDGALDTAQPAWGPIGTDDDPVLIGENAQERNRFWNGMIDDVRVYNFGLSEAQVQELYNREK